jgi:hypothetical protein
MEVDNSTSEGPAAPSTHTKQIRHLIVDANPEPAPAIPRQDLETVAGKCHQISNRSGSLDAAEFQPRRSFES